MFFDTMVSPGIKFIYKTLEIYDPMWYIKRAEWMMPICSNKWLCKRIGLLWSYGSWSTATYAISANHH